MEEESAPTAAPVSAALQTLPGAPCSDAAREEGKRACVSTEDFKEVRESDERNGRSLPGEERGPS